MSGINKIKNNITTGQSPIDAVENVLIYDLSCEEVARAGGKKRLYDTAWKFHQSHSKKYLFSTLF